MSRVAISYILFIYCFRESLLNKSYSVYPLMLTRNPEQHVIKFLFYKASISYNDIISDTYVLDNMYAQT